MKLAILFGPHAVGKMTVGQALAKSTGLKLFHNHMTIEVVSELFENMPSERSRLTALFRKEIFEAYSKSDE
ncbi:MAG TPA: shikimate kinase, partial [Clostridia bacterium]|nr:shikimate kinase [Clostridia bacterium]